MIDFPKVATNLTKIQEELDTRMVMCAQYHEIFKICQTRKEDPFKFVPGYLNIIQSDLTDLALTSLESIDVSINILNKYFKNEIIADLWETEKFSISEG